MVTVTILEDLAPQRLKMSYEEYLEFAADSRIVEWVEGEVIIYMPPAREHQDLVLFLSQLLNLFIQFFDLGVLIVAPFEVKLRPNGPSREPDLIFISQASLSKLTSQRFEGGPDLIIEVISPSSVTEDRVHKFTEYEQAGVREYWIIDARPHQHHIDFYILGADQLYHPGSVDDNGIYYSKVIPNFWFNLAWLWQVKLPNPQVALAEIMISIAELPAEVKDTYRAIHRLLTGKS